jgi:hypothetical protein
MERPRSTHDYLLHYGWEYEFRKDLSGYVYRHHNFPNMVFTAQRAKERMDEQVQQRINSGVTFKMDAQGISDCKEFIKKFIEPIINQ